MFVLFSILPIECTNLRGLRSLRTGIREFSSIRKLRRNYTFAPRGFKRAQQLRLHNHGRRMTSKSYLMALDTRQNFMKFKAAKSDDLHADGQTGPMAGCIPQDQSHSVSHKHRIVRDSFEDVPEKHDVASKSDSVCLMPLQAADSDPSCNGLQHTQMAVNQEHSPRRRWFSTNAIISRAKDGNTEFLDLHRTASLPVEKVYIAIGSNLGDRVKNIELACNCLTKRGIVVARTSALYETQPMYLEDQGLFLNSVCEAKTSLAPLQLLDQLKEIEVELGRKETVANGPRVIDLDILLYGRTTFENDRLSIPHKGIMEREFVLRPLCDLIPRNQLPGHSVSFDMQLKRLNTIASPLSPLTPISSHLPPLQNLKPNRLTNIMTIINMTPDSFSDGGVHLNDDPKATISQLQESLDLTRGIAIIDVGGQSTRPNAKQIDPKEELSRILPTIKAIRSDPFFARVVVSVDTYRASVASAAVEAGADIINDVSAGQLDSKMLPNIARLGCTCILMHMRGTPKNMNNFADYPQGVIKEVAQELAARVREAEMAGIRRWRICLDPGIGFAKTQKQNLEILRRFDELKNHPDLRGFPWVVGISRKGFIGKIIGVDRADEREFGTAAAVTAAIQGGADIVRVHDTEKMGQVAKMADAIWRVAKSP